MTSQDSQRATAPTRDLRRRSNDRVIGGVAGGLGDYFNIDALLFRIGFVGLIIFGGAGLLLYVVAWLLLPAEGHDTSILEGFFRRLRLTPSRIFGIAVLAFVVLVLVNSWNPGVDVSLREGPLGIPGAVWALIIIMAGVLLLRRHQMVASPAMAPAMPAAAPLVAPAVQAPPRPRSPLAWYVYAAVLLTIGLLAIVSQVAEVEVMPGQFFGAALTVIGIGLVVGAWWGRARILILIALLVMPIAVMASFVTAPLEGGIGDNRYAPANSAELRDEYRLMSGRMILDLTELSVGAQPIHIAASVAVGQLVVVLPLEGSVEIRTRVGAGVLSVFDSSEGGTSLDNVYVRRQRFGPRYILDLQSGIGEVWVMGGALGATR